MQVKPGRSRRARYVGFGALVLWGRNFLVKGSRFSRGGFGGVVLKWEGTERRDYAVSEIGFGFCPCLDDGRSGGDASWPSGTGCRRLVLLHEPVGVLPDDPPLQCGLARSSRTITSGGNRQKSRCRQSCRCEPRTCAGGEWTLPPDRHTSKESRICVRGSRASCAGGGGEKSHNRLFGVSGINTIRPHYRLVSSSIGESSPILPTTLRAF